jgi:hypothetical protein
MVELPPGRTPLITTIINVMKDAMQISAAAMSKVIQEDRGLLRTTDSLGLFGSTNTALDSTVVRSSQISFLFSGK